ncbi:hypothetical protein HFN89_00710 [Rhizobium laguerreae]|nr:hypothetical protein [Rhizobium laguerreae]
MKTSILQMSAFQHDETLEEIVSRYVDPFFIDSTEVSFEASTNALVGVFTAEFFGSCSFKKLVVGDVEEDLKSMAALAHELLERKHTEAASQGQMAEAARPVFIPDDIIYEFVEWKD